MTPDQPGTARAHVELHEVVHGFGNPDAVALGPVALSVPRGQRLVLLGPSGCGKTTLLRVAAGLVRPDGGRALVQGQAPRPGQAGAMVFQSFRLLPWKTARQNVGFALGHLSHGERMERAQRYLDLVGLGRFAERYPAALSGGMKQRLALARALAAEADLLLMDEPFASLDAQARELMQHELLRLLRARPATVIFVTHSVDEALLIGDRVVLLSPRPGRVVEDLALPFRGDDPALRRADPDFSRLRDGLWHRLRDMVLSDPASDFYGRGTL
ncbi:ABC transporter ATP-binding protein [Plastorhodobacter daqingensis]|uniref:ABC transporter ATP-binding protein n=1 Tax=Plastorhodobacter daqingensis TaxID=1387281 RepID=A0ABW2ULQ8_9RHOB